MNLRDLEYLVAVADLQHFGRAAQQCHVSQPTLSSQIKKLEDELGVPIFERTKRQILPTETGTQIINAARRVLAEANALREIAATAQDPFGGRYRIGAFPTLASYLLPHIVPLLKQALPQIRLVLVEEKSDALLQKLRGGQIDASFLALPVASHGLHTAALFDDRFVVAVSDAHALAQRSSIDADALARHRLLLLDEGHCFRDQALEVCHLMGVSEDADFRATSLETLRHMVRANSGVTLMPEIAMRTPDDGIKYIPFEGPPPSRSIAFVRRKTCSRAAVFGRVEEVVRGWANDEALRRSAHD